MKGVGDCSVVVVGFVMLPRARWAIANSLIYINYTVGVYTYYCYYYRLRPS